MNAEVQDVVRATEGFFAAILETTRMDEKYPIVREFSLLAIRNLCEGVRRSTAVLVFSEFLPSYPSSFAAIDNKENQEYVGELSLQPDQKVGPKQMS